MRNNFLKHRRCVVFAVPLYLLLCEAKGIKTWKKERNHLLLSLNPARFIRFIVGIEVL